MSTSHDPVSVVQRQLDAYNALDLERFVAEYTDDVRVFRLPGRAPVLSGKAALREHYRLNRFARPGLHAEVLHRMIIGSTVIDHERVVGIEAGPVEMAAIYEVGPGGICSVWFAGGRSAGEASVRPPALEAWHHLVRTADPRGLRDLLAADAVFHSPIVHTPQRGGALVQTYLTAAFAVFFNDSFRYLREVIDGDSAVLEFETTLDGVVVNGVDMIRWNGEQQIVEFKVMLRPLKAVNLIHAKMAQMLEAAGRAPAATPSDDQEAP